MVALGFDGTRFANSVIEPSRVRHEAHDLDGEDPTTPWRRVLDGERRASCAVPDLPEPWQSRARALGFHACWAFAVDRAHPHRDVLVVWRTIPGRPAAHLRDTVDRIVDLMQLAIESRRHRERLERRANTDELTGLVNRTGLSRHVDRLRSDRTGTSLGVAYLDIDDFKPVNDAHGHQVGDHVLQVVARRLGATVRAGDVAARVGGDEFAVLCPGIGDADLARLADRLVAAFRAPIDVDGLVVDISVSVGVALAGPEEQGRREPEALLAGADSALLRAKARGKGTWEHHSSGPRSDTGPPSARS